MSALAGQPDHFIDWMEQPGNANFAPDTFVPRSLYGEYIEHTLRRSLDCNPHCQVTYVTGNAVSLAHSESGFKVCLEDGANIQSSVAVLAMGNTRPSDRLRGKRIAKRFYADFAWEESALRDIPTDGSVLLIGSGLTAIDQVLGLRAQGFRGTITMVSRPESFPLSIAHRFCGRPNGPSRCPLPCRPQPEKYDARMISLRNAMWIGDPSLTRFVRGHRPSGNNGLSTSTAAAHSPCH
jgi:uncharacterized NAD(P)/FAD-binding protein YdhS